MYFDDHNPPHFHAVYAEYEARINIDTLTVISGQLPSRALSLVTEWAGLHQSELQDLWQNAIELKPLYSIDPLT